MVDQPSWKLRLYGSYVSSGQAGSETVSDPVRLFHPRKAFLNRLFAQHLPKDKNIQILDVGCGHGAILYFLQEAGYKNAAGIDISEEQIELAHKLGIHGAQLGNLDDFLAERKDACVDVVLAMDVLEHLTMPELLDSLDSIRRILRVGGMCLVHVPNAEGLFGMRIRYGDFTHEQAFTPRSAMQIFHTVGFKDVSCYEDKPAVHGTVSFVRRAIWDIGTLYPRILLSAETGTTAPVLSQNMLIKAVL